MGSRLAVWQRQKPVTFVKAHFFPPNKRQTLFLDRWLSWMKFADSRADDLICLQFASYFFFLCGNGPAPLGVAIIQPVTDQPSAPFINQPVA